MSAKVESPRSAAGWKAAAAALVAVLLATSWMVFSLVAGKAGLGKALTAQSSGEASLSQALTRTGITKDRSKIQALFAVPEYYERTGQAEAAAETDPDKYLVFIVSESDHRALTPAVPTLLADGKPVGAPMKDRILSASDHHRTRMIRFVKVDAQGTLYVPASARSLELAWPDIDQVHRADHSLANPLSWDLPLALPSDTAGKGLTPWAFLLLTAGLFAALSPCLVQLTLYYLSALAGTTAPDGTVDRKRIMMVASLFSAGIAAAYVIGGVLAGYLGRTIQVSDVLGDYGRYLALVAGAVIIWMGFRTVLSSQAPLVCRMPMPGIGKLARWKMGPASPFLMGFLMALGCLQCFGGAIFGSLLLYVGSLGSPGLGALMLGLFSLGVALPFLAAAFAWEKVARRLEGLQRVMQTVSLVSGVLMMTFGVLMVIDRFHWISGLVLEWLPFLRA